MTTDGPAGWLSPTTLLRALGDLRSNVNLEPLPVMTVRKYTVNGDDVAVVEVMPSDLPPVRYKGRVWIRVGPSRRGANQQEERILTERRTALQRTFDTRPCHGSTSKDLIPDLFLVTYLPAAVAHDIIEENRRDRDEQMASLRFYDLAADCPTNAGVLLFAKDPLHWIPGAWVQFVRWAGKTIADDPIATRRFSGDLLSVLRDVNAFVSLPTQSYPVAESVLRERTETDYPPVAIRELLLNAIMHRSYESNAPVRFYWYDDRIEIQNPGGLYGMASPENFPRADGLPQSRHRRSDGDARLRQRVRAWCDSRTGSLAQEREPRCGVRVRAFARACDNPEKAVITIAFFNNKGGVGKTSLVYHLAWMYADLGISTVAVDIDPQANLSTMFLEEDRLEELWPDGDHPQSILGAVSPILRGIGDVSEPHVETITGNLGVVVGDLGLSRFEARLSSAWPACLDRDEAAFRIESAFHRTILEGGRAVRCRCGTDRRRSESGRHQPIGNHCGGLRRVSACPRSLLPSRASQPGADASGLAQRVEGSIGAPSGRSGPVAASGRNQPRGLCRDAARGESGPSRSGVPEMDAPDPRRLPRRGTWRYGYETLPRPKTTPSASPHSSTIAA